MNKHIQSHFPKALPNSQIVAETLTKVKKATHIQDPKKILLAASDCADEICVLHKEFEKNGVLGSFKMGGLAGFPFTGLTGVTAYAHHVPDHGVAIVIYGPHIGVNNTGTLTKVHRQGMSNEGTSCGALMLAFSRFVQNSNYQPDTSTHDTEQNLLEKYLQPNMPAILSASNKELALINTLFTLIDTEVKFLVEQKKVEFHCQAIVLLGGIMINTHPDLEDYFDLRTFDIINLHEER